MLRLISSVLLLLGLLSGCSINNREDLLESGFVKLETSTPKNSDLHVSIYEEEEEFFISGTFHRFGGLSNTFSFGHLDIKITDALKNEALTFKVNLTKLRAPRRHSSNKANFKIGIPSSPAEGSIVTINYDSGLHDH